MANTYTNTKTNTATRIEFVLNHFRSTLYRLTNLKEREIEVILDGIRREEIESLEFIGYNRINNKNVVYVKLELSIDWDEHHNLKSREPLIKYSNKFEDGSSPEIFGLIYLTQQTIQNKKLTCQMLYGYSKAIRSDFQRLTQIRKKYGTSPSNTTYDYSNLNQTENCRSPEAPELGARCQL